MVSTHVGYKGGRWLMGSVGLKRCNYCGGNIVRRKIRIIEPGLPTEYQNEVAEKKKIVRHDLD